MGCLVSGQPYFRSVFQLYLSSDEQGCAELTLLQQELSHKLLTQANWSGNILSSYLSSEGTTKNCARIR